MRIKCLIHVFHFFIRWRLVILLFRSRILSNLLSYCVPAIPVSLHRLGVGNLLLLRL